MHSESCGCGHRYAVHTYFPNRFPCLQCACKEFSPKLLLLGEKHSAERRPPARARREKDDEEVVLRA